MTQASHFHYGTVEGVGFVDRQTWVCIWVLPFSCFLRLESIGRRHSDKDLRKGDLGNSHTDVIKRNLERWGIDKGRFSAGWLQLSLFPLGNCQRQCGTCLSLSLQRKRSYIFFQLPSFIVWIIHLRPLTPWHFCSQWTFEKNPSWGELQYDPINSYGNHVYEVDMCLLY